MRREDLKVAEVRVDEGPTFKRAKPKNRGGRHPIIEKNESLHCRCQRRIRSNLMGQKTNPIGFRLIRNKQLALKMVCE